MLSYELLDKISMEYGDSFYLIDSGTVENNYHDMIGAFRAVYPKTRIAYSYKTNYTPRLCKLIDTLGGDAEVVSEMEMWLAGHIGVQPSRIYYNGPYKKYLYVEEALLKGIHVNLDGDYEIAMLREIAGRYPDRMFKVGLRCHIDVGQSFPSRFGFDAENGSLADAVTELSNLPNVSVTGLHCHIPFRTLESYRQRVERMNEILDGLPELPLEYISMGGGYLGKISEQMLDRFSFMPPAFTDYADVVAGFMKERYSDKPDAPTLIIEPGSAVVADAMQYVARVVNIKRVRNIDVAGMSGSTFQMNPSVKDMNRPVEVYRPADSVSAAAYYDDLYMAGYTCIESDYLYKGYQGKLGIGDFVVFHNVGSYSVVMKPPFILPDIPMLEIQDGDKVCVWKRAQTPEDVFALFA